jgi:ribosomal protein S18 acetylase RimI-like enzyme
MINLVPATTIQHLRIIEKLAHDIWNEHYTPIIGKTQVDYMLDKFQNVDAMLKQIENNYKYFIINYNKTDIGYLAFKINDFDLFLSKIYILKDFRGKSFGKQAMDFVFKQAEVSECKTITLTVNKNNSNSIKVYEKIGFINIEKLVQDIGCGFVMDDYKMVKNLN